MILKTIDISKSYSGKNVFQNVSLNFEKPEIVALLGPNGAGKSTLLRCLVGLEKADTGILILGDKSVDFANYSDENLNLWPEITLVFQQFYLWPHLSVKDNILLALRKRFPKSYYQVFEKIVFEYDLEGLLKQFPNEISVGQKQKVALARAIALNPKILLLDEITSSLDNNYSLRICEHLKSLKQQGTLILMVTHSINFAIHCSDKYIVLDHGAVQEQGRIREIYSPKSDYLKKCLSNKGYLI